MGYIHKILPSKLRELNGEKAKNVRPRMDEGYQENYSLQVNMGNIHKNSQRLISKHMALCIYYGFKSSVFVRFLSM